MIMQGVWGYRFVVRFLDRDGVRRRAALWAPAIGLLGLSIERLETGSGGQVRVMSVSGVRLRVRVAEQEEGSP